AYLFGGALRVPGGGDYREFLMPGMFAMTMVFGISLTTLAVSADLDRGVTDRLRSMPVSPLAPLVGRAAADLLFAVLTLAVMLLVGLAVGWRAHGGVGDTVAAFGLILLLRFALVWVGVFLGLVLKGQQAVAGVQTLEFPLGFLSSAFVAPATPCPAGSARSPSGIRSRRPSARPGSCSATPAGAATPGPSSTRPRWR
ncbi:ABC transporter permease, partial [Micromonospora sp. DH15]|nr:ABC transporter permease [Micromonospora sp. DH15]